MTCRTFTTRSRNTLAARVAVLCTAIALAACTRGDDGPPRTEQRGIDVFHSVDLRGAADVKVSVGGATSLSITAAPTALSDVLATVRNGTLVIEHRKGTIWFAGDRRMQIEITVPELHAFAVNGAGNVHIDGVNGSALALVLQGAGNLVASGRSTALNARINGAGNMDLSALSATDATVAVNGAGNLTTHVTGSLQAEVNGVGSIRYGGSPTQLDTRIHGVGSIAPVSPGGT